MREIKSQIKITSSLLTLIVVAGVLFSSNPTSATSVSTATASVKVASACTMSISGGGSYSATIPNGTSSEITGSTFSATCNDANGFALYAVGNSNNTLGNTNLIGTSTNIATNTSGNDSYWAMKVNPTTGNTPTIDNSFDSFHIVPNAHTKVASYSGSTGTGSLSVDATYKANISSTQLAGNYLGKVKYTLIHPSAGPAPAAPLAASDCPARNICYAPNADDIEGTMLGREFSVVSASSKAGRQTRTYNSSGSMANITTNSIVLLAAYNYYRPGYGFAGWSPSYEASTASGSTDIIYGPQATISTNPNDPEGADVSTNGLILYPVWVASTGSMQSFTSANCSAMNVGDVTARTDIRDGNTYTIAKLPDGNSGKCWMVENLRLNNDASITPSNTQSNNDTFGGVFTGLAKSEDANFVVDTTANSLYSTDGTTINVISDGSKSYWGSRMPRFNNNNTNIGGKNSVGADLVAGYANNSTNTAQWYGYGNYYSWPAAVADTTYYNTNNQSITSTSLCPTGWRLPRGGDRNNEANNDFWALIVTGLNNGVNPANYDSNVHPFYIGTTEGVPISNSLRTYPYNFVYSGFFSGSYANNRGLYGNYWSSTVYDSYYSYSPLLTRSTVYPGAYTSYEKDKAQSIRCLAGS